MNTEESIRRIFGHDTARLREFIKLTEELFATEDARAEAYFTLAKMEAETSPAPKARRITKAQQVELLTGAEVQLIENTTGKLLFCHGTKLSEIEARHIVSSSNFEIENGLLMTPFGQHLRYVFLDPALTTIAR